MTQKTSIVSDWLVTDNYRAKAQIKYELKHLESRLHKYWNTHNHFDGVLEEVQLLCATLASRYQDYLRLVHGNNLSPAFTSPESPIMNWTQRYQVILILKQQLQKSNDSVDEAKLIAEIAFHYAQCIQSAQCSEAIFHEVDSLDDLKQLFKTTNLKTWLALLVSLWNHSTIFHNNKSLQLMHDWSLQQLQSAMDFFAVSERVDLVNAIFFYKLYPDKLFDELIHPEKLVSIRMRLGVLHECIELLQQHLSTSFLSHGLQPEVDLFFHGDELPHGIMIEVNDEFREIIQLSVKNIKVQFTPENEQKVTLDRLHDLGLAYKFWFNPNRLIDAVMVLQQRLVNESIVNQTHLPLFHEQMLLLYRKLTTSECLDLYGHFANNDSRYLLYTLHTIVQGAYLDWLPALHDSEKSALARVFNALQCVMEALREELKIRHVTTEPYHYDYEKEVLQVGRRNREAVFRIITVYGREAITLNDSLEQLFRCIEEPVKK